MTGVNFRVLGAAVSAAIVAGALGANSADAKINKVVSGHVATGGGVGGNANYLFPLHTGLNKVTIQGNAAMLTARAVTVAPLKATVRIVGRGSTHLHLNINVSGEAPDGQTGDGIVRQPANKGGVPDKWRWKVYKRGTVTRILVPNGVAKGEVKNVVFQGRNMEKAKLRTSNTRYTVLSRTGRSATAVTYAIRFDKCMGSGTSISSAYLHNEGLPPSFISSTTSSAFLGNQAKTIRIAGCGQLRNRGGALMQKCRPGYWRPNPNRGCVRR